MNADWMKTNKLAISSQENWVYDSPERIGDFCIPNPVQFLHCEMRKPI